MTPHLIVRRSPDPVDRVVHRLREVVAQRHIQEFCVIDHQQGAEEAGLALPGETVVIFGNPAVGTALMQLDPRCGLDLPLRVLVSQSDDGSEIVYRDPRSLADDYDLSEATDTLEKLATVLDVVSSAALRPE